MPLANLLMVATGAWTSVLLVASACSLTSGLLAKFVLVPMRQRLAARTVVTA